MKLIQDMTEPELRDLLNGMARAVLSVAGSAGVEKPMFALVLFNDPKVGQYVGNCRREDMVLALRETADRLEGREDVPR